jgi:hypothetical protein
MADLCGNPLRLDNGTENTVLLACDKPAGHGGRHASYDHGCPVAIGEHTGFPPIQCELPPGHKGPHRATAEPEGTAWTLVWADRCECDQFRSSKDDARCCANCGALHRSKNPADWKE